MASTTFYGSETCTYWNPSINSTSTIDKCWHSGDKRASGQYSAPIMQGGGVLTATRNGSVVSGSVTDAWSTLLKKNGAYYNFPIYIVVYANGNWLAQLDIAASSGGTFSGKSLSFSIDSASAVTISVAFVCGQTGGCQVETYPMTNASLYFEAYNPWKEPTNLSSVKVSPTSIKPDGSTKVSWTAAKAGTGNSITKYRVQIRRKRGTSWGSWTTLSSSITSTSYTVSLPISGLNIRPGDTIGFRVAAYMTSNTSGYSSKWLSDVGANSNVSIYKDGIVYYIAKDGGAKTECTMAYYKNSSGTMKKSRYMVVKDIKGTTHVIDMYTTYYE